MQKSFQIHLHNLSFRAVLNDARKMEFSARKVAHTECVTNIFDVNDIRAMESGVGVFTEFFIIVSKGYDSGHENNFCPFCNKLCEDGEELIFHNR